MKINKLKPGINNIELEAKILEINEPRQVNTKFGTLVNLFECKLEDNTGSIKLVLWGKQADGLSEGKKIKIKGGFTKIFRNELQIGIGKTGSIKIIE
ncbi:MAG: hypothetical protein J7K26_03245 [Candidatus Aenigmarchaeota archaeon]|nr:hypothetical protein [Candidatus Aenigmarchaeota archaeon]